MREPESAARASLRRSLLFYVVLLALDLLLLGYLLSVGVTGIGYATVVVVAVVGVLLAFQAWLHLRDFNAPATETSGVIVRKWSRADMIVVWHSYYLTVGRTVFRVAPQDYVMVDEQMHVRVVHFPRTLNVVSVREERPTSPAPVE